MTEDLQKVKDLLKTRGCIDRTTTNYLSCINRSKNYYSGKKVKLEKLKTFRQKFSTIKMVIQNGYNNKMSC